jgi:hypothetical protein
MFVYCPQTGCTLPAAIERTDLWPSTRGGVVMSKVQCPASHWFLMPFGQLDGVAP